MHSIHIFIKFAAARAQGHRQRYSGGIGATAAEGGHAAIGAHALEARDHRDRALAKAGN